MTGVNSLPCGWDLRKEKKIPGVVQDLAMVPHMPLSSDAARHVGDPVAVVIAETQTAATDAAEKVEVDWDVQTSVTTTAARHRGRRPADARRCARQRRLQVGARRRGGHRGGLQGCCGHGEEAHRQPAAGRQRHGAARVRGPLRRRHRRAHAVGDLAEPARAPAADVRLRPRHPRAQGAGHRARRGRRLRLQDLPLQRGGRLLVGVPAAQAAGALDVDAARGVPDRRARPRPRHRRRDGAVGRRQDPRRCA